MSIKIASMNFGDCDTILHNTPNGMKNIAEVLGPNGEVYWSAIKELTGIPPLSIRSNGTMLLDYLISGNTVQNDTPTPSNPVDVNGVGVRTENLFDAIWESGSLGANGGMFDTTDAIRTKSSMPCEAEKTYTFVPDIDSYGEVWVNYYGTTNSRERIDRRNGTFTTPQGCEQVRFRVTKSNIGVEPVQQYNAMFNEGSTTKPYAPYGYKIPISNGQQTTNIYLGSTQTTRCVKKLVLTGQENWGSSHLDVNLFALSGIDDTAKGLKKTTISTHYQSQTNAESWALVIDNRVCFHAYSNSNILYIRDSTYATVADFTTYLSQQYANGTPVTVWYALATPETAVVNEPLMKIDTYADTLSMEQTGVQIPTNRGNTVIDVETALKPSQMYIKYK